MMSTFVWQDSQVAAKFKGGTCESRFDEGRMSWDPWQLQHLGMSESLPTSICPCLVYIFETSSWHSPQLMTGTLSP